MVNYSFLVLVIFVKFTGEKPRCKTKAGEYKEIGSSGYTQGARRRD